MVALPMHRRHTEAEKRRISEAMKGKNSYRHDKAHNKRISDGMKKYWARRQAGLACSSKSARAEIARREIKKLLGDKCHICQKAPRRGWTAHHLSYEADGVHYARSPSYHKGGGRWASNDYALALVSEVRAHPDRFVPLCHRHHYGITRMLNMPPDKLGRLIDVLMRSYPGAHADKHADKNPAKEATA